MSIDDKRRYASAAFITLLTLSIFWPSPIVSSNRLWLQYDLTVDELSFLGREAPSWDVVFWCIAGLLALAIVQSGDFTNWRERLREAVGWDIRGARATSPVPAGGVARAPRVITWLLAGLGIVAITWIFLDSALLAVAERIQSERTETLIRYANRLGGGMNPPMIVIFFALAGLAYRMNAWIRISAAMAVGALGAGAIAHLLKLLVGRTRPELWLGPFHYAHGSANSFPSGHTVGAFALAGVLLFGARSYALRIIAILLAIGVGLSRILAFRHWTSDVVASAFLGLLAAWLALAITVPRAAVPERLPPDHD